MKTIWVNRSVSFVFWHKSSLNAKRFAVFTAKKLGCETIKTNAVCKHSKAFKSLQLGQARSHGATFGAVHPQISFVPPKFCYAQKNLF